MAQVLATYGHDLQLQEDGAVLLLSDPTVVCYRDAAHIVAVTLAGLSILVVIAGLPVFLMLVILPQIDATVAASPASEWLRSAKHLLEVSVEYARSTDGYSGCPWMTCLNQSSLSSI